MPDQSIDNSSSDSARRKIPSDYKIRVIFRGFIVTRIQAGTEPVWIAALAQSVSDCHRPKIRVHKLFTPVGSGRAAYGHSQDITPPDLIPEADISLTVYPQGTGVELFQLDSQPFNRLDERHNSRKDFRWFINLNDLHGTQVTPIAGKLSPKFTLNKGLFHTSDRSEGELLVHPGNGSADRHYGRFAVELSARIYLREPESYATCVGNVNLFPPIRAEDTGFKYDVVYDCTCRVNDDAPTSDFSLIYDAVSLYDPNKRVEMKPEDEEEAKSASPEVYCIGGNINP